MIEEPSTAVSGSTLLATALVAGLSALLGSWAGARSALERYRAERAFDRQVDWYDRAAKAIASGVDAIESALFLEAENRHDEAMVYWQRIPASLLAIAEAGVEADLYADRSSRDALQSAIGDLNAIDRESKADAKTDKIGARTKMGSRMLTVLKATRLSVANDMRAKLSLKPI